MGRPCLDTGYCSSGHWWCKWCKQCHHKTL